MPSEVCRLLAGRSDASCRSLKPAPRAASARRCHNLSPQPSAFQPVEVSAKPSPVERHQARPRTTICAEGGRGSREGHAEPLPLLILLHKAGGSASEWFSGGGSHTRRTRTRDVSLFLRRNRPAQPGVPDQKLGLRLLAINRALEEAFTRCAIDRNRLAIGGFSDGASYALSLGLANGDVFSFVIAFSPGFIVRAQARGKLGHKGVEIPLVYIAHGQQIMSCRLPRRVVSS